MGGKCGWRQILEGLERSEFGHYSLAVGSRGRALRRRDMIRPELSLRNPNKVAVRVMALSFEKMEHMTISEGMRRGQVETVVVAQEVGGRLWSRKGNWSQGL